MANKKYEDIDIVAFLEEKMKSNTKHYQSDFEIDKEFILKMAASKRKEDKTLLWMSRSSGTHCFKEHDTFVRDTSACITWLYYAEQTQNDVIAYAVEVCAVRDGVVHGNVYELDYASHTKEVAVKAVELLEVEKTFEDGFVVRVPMDRSSYGFYSNLVEEHGSIVDSFAIPRDQAELCLVLNEQKSFRDKFKLVKSDSCKDKPALDEVITEASAKVLSRSEVNKDVPFERYS